MDKKQPDEIIDDFELKHAIERAAPHFLYDKKGIFLFDCDDDGTVQGLKEDIELAKRHPHLVRKEMDRISKEFSIRLEKEHGKELRQMIKRQKKENNHLKRKIHMTKIIQKLKRFCNQTHVHKVLSTIYQACLIAAIAVGILIVVVYGINAVVS